MTADVKSLGECIVASVYDKTGLAEFVRGLRAMMPKVEVVSSGGTAKFLREHGEIVTEVSDFTGFPEMLGGRVKTLHPKVHGGILANLAKEEDVEELRKNNFPRTAFVIVNLYPFAETIAKPGATVQDAIENIDIGGVALLRGAAKNADWVVPICDTADYGPVLDEMRANDGNISPETRRRLRIKVFALTSLYDGDILTYFERQESKRIPDNLRIAATRRGSIRYCENPHQDGGMYDIHSNDPLGAYRFTVIQGKVMSYNNEQDLTAAVNTFSYLGGERPACIIVKHTNPCGAAYGKDIGNAFSRAWDGDPVAAYGGIIVVNRPIDEKTAKRMLPRKRFVEIIAAPEVSKEAAKFFAKKKDLRIAINPALTNPPLPVEYEVKKIRGAMLVQEPDVIQINMSEVLTKVKPTKRQLRDMYFAWQICRNSKSNTITIVKDEKLLGNGVGQQDRRECCKLAVGKANAKKRRSPGSVAASDAFFPFPDGPGILIRAGIKAIIQPGGSKRDQETIDLCNTYGIAMVTTGKDKKGNRIRGFRH